MDGCKITRAGGAAENPRKIFFVEEIGIWAHVAAWELELPFARRASNNSLKTRPEAIGQIWQVELIIVEQIAFFAFGCPVKTPQLFRKNGRQNSLNFSKRKPFHVQFLERAGKAA